MAQSLSLWFMHCTAINRHKTCSFFFLSVLVQECLPVSLFFCLFLCLCLSLCLSLSVAVCLSLSLSVCLFLSLSLPLPLSLSIPVELTKRSPKIQSAKLGFCTSRKSTQATRDLPESQEVGQWEIRRHVRSQALISRR